MSRRALCISKGYVLNEFQKKCVVWAEYIIFVQDRLCYKRISMPKIKFLNEFYETIVYISFLIQITKQRRYSFSFPFLVIIEKGKETYIYRIITKFFFNGVSSYKKKNCVMYTYFIPNCREIFTTERFQIQCFHMQILLDNNIVGSFLKTTFGKMYFDLSSEDSTGNIPYYHYNIFSL